MSLSFERLCVGVFLGTGLIALQGAEKVDFEKDIRVILESACLNCHNVNNVKGKLRLETRALAIQGGENGPVLVPGKPEESPLYTATTLPPENEHAMPPAAKAPPLTKLQIEQLRQWIEDGAVWPENLTLQPIRRILFVQDIQPILETSCLSCHREGQEKGKLRLETRQTAFKGGENGPVLVPGHPEKSALYTATVLDPSQEKMMPPKDKGGPLPKEKTELLREWIRQGASWPDNWVLKPRAAEIAKRVDETLLVTEIYKRIQENQTVTSAADMRPYTNTIPGTSVRYAMIPIPPGEFRMGSPESEPGRKPDEGPLHQVKVDAFWMGRCEVTWNEFELFMYPSTELKKKMAEGITLSATNTSDAVARPSAPYVDLSFGMGKESNPAISMTQHAANKYCEWLSAKTGHFYRLPTEAEWEHACRAGTTTAYSFGDDPSKLGEYAWYGDNSDWKYQKVGTKKPNPWGLYDMHGNVAEWCLDQHQEDFYQKFNPGVADNPWNKATQPYPHVVRGGSWDDDAGLLRSAARRASSRQWKMQDPQLPKSVWYHTDAQFLGFRIIRPLGVPPLETVKQFWNSGVEKD